MAVSLVALAALLSLGVDLGMLFTARSEAQRAADAAALAGASAFLDHRRRDVVEAATVRAVEYAVTNRIRGEAVVAGDVAVRVIPDSFKVRVAVRRDGVPTLFARLLDVDAVDVSAAAAAQATDGGAARCVKPFAVPDAWEETSDDLNGNRIWDDGERWRFDPDRGDRYAPYSGPDGGPDETGYGSAWRNGFADGDGRRYENDYGRRIVLKVTDPRRTFTESFFFPFVLPPDPDQPGCDGRWGGTGKGGGRGAAAYRRNICACNGSLVDLEDEYLIEPGNMVGPTWQGVRELIERDPDAYWDGAESRVVSEHGLSSPRVITVALFDPAEIARPGRQTLRFNNFGLVFLEEQKGPQDPVVGRFLYYVSGAGAGDREGKATGSLVKVLRLVE